VSLADIAEFLGARSIGAWLLILALPMVLPVSAPGISILFGMPLMMISAQLMDSGAARSRAQITRPWWVGRCRSCGALSG
jgi:hypothetical protein